MDKEWNPKLEYDCGCQILERVSGKSQSGTQIIATRIGYCPMHKVAPKLYEALKAVFAHQEIINGRVVQRGMPTESEIFMMQKSMTEAEGK